MSIQVLFLAIVACIWTWASADLVSALRRVPNLHDYQPVGGPPDVSVVIASRNEADHLQATLQCLMATRVFKEIIVVNDRSDDETKSILEDWMTRTPRVKAIHVSELPHGWLGKNHALHVGAGSATGNWILFTDADVRISEEAVPRALAIAKKYNAGHVTVCPRMKSRGFFLRMAIAFFIQSFSLAVRPWRAHVSTSRSSVGVGAFNLVRKDAYDAIGGHTTIRMRPDDDLKLGERIKRHGFTSVAALGPEYAEVEWYPTLRAMVSGMEKNILVPTNYRPWLVGFPVLGLLILYEGPFLSLLGDHRWITWSLALWTYILQTYTAWRTAKICDASTKLSWLSPLGALIFVYIMVRAAFIAIRLGGIRWRGTTYDLRDIRSQN